MTFPGHSYPYPPDENISSLIYILADSHFSGAQLDEISDDDEKTSLTEEATKYDLSDEVTKRDNEDENREDNVISYEVEEGLYKVEMSEDDVELREDEIELRKDGAVEEITLSSSPEENIEVAEAFDVCASDVVEVGETLATCTPEYEVGEALATCTLEYGVGEALDTCTPEDDNAVGEDVEEQQQQLVVCAPEEKVEVGETLAACSLEGIDVGEASAACPPEEDNAVGEDVEEQQQLVVCAPGEDVEVGESLAACAPDDDDVEDLTERKDYLKVMTDILKELLKSLSCDTDYENGLEACMVEFISGKFYMYDSFEGLINRMQ